MAYSGVLTFVRQPAPLRVFQRDSRTGGVFGLGSGAVDVAISASAPIHVLEFQLRDYRSQAVTLLPWTIAASNLAAASQTVNLTLPASAAWYAVDLRANGDSSSTITLAGGIGVGEVIAAAGQSLATDFWSTTANNDSTTIAGLGVNVSTFCSALAAWDGGTLPTSATAWAPPSDNGPYRSAFAAEFLRLVVAASGVNAALVGYGHSGTDIGTYWLPGLTDYTNLASVLSTAGGKFGTFLWCQGHNDADARSGSQYHLTPASRYLADLQNLFGSLTSTFTSMNFQRILCSIPAIAGAASLKYSISGIEAIRSAHLRYIASDSLATYVDGLDVGLSTDGIHPSQAGNVTLARHFYRAFLGGFRANSAGDRGPAFVGAAIRASGSRQITLPVRHAGGTRLALVGDPSSQFKVYPAGQTSSAMAIASVDASPSQVTITLASAPADTQALDVWYRLPFDSSLAIASGIYDENAGDGDGLTLGRQLAMQPYPLIVAAPAQSWRRSALIGPGCADDDF